jgi:chromosome segregation ATPase
VSQALSRLRNELSSRPPQLEAEIEALRGELTIERAKAALAAVGQTPPRTPRMATPAANADVEQKRAPTSVDDRARSLLAIREKKIAALECTVEDLRSQLSGRSGAAAVIAARAAAPDTASADRIDALTKACTALQEELAREKSAHAKALEERNVAREGVSSSKADAQAARVASEKLRAELERAKALIGNLQVRATRLQTDADNCRARLASARDQDLQKRVATLQSQLTLASKARDILNDRVAELEATAAASKASALSHKMQPPLKQGAFRPFAACCILQPSTFHPLFLQAQFRRALTDFRKTSPRRQRSATG